MYHFVTRFIVPALLLSVAVAPTVCAAQPTGVQTTSGELDKLSISELHQRLYDGTLSVQTLTQYFLNRIARFDRGGPHINSVIEVNPDALKIARKLDAEPKSLAHSQPLYGIPILLKDNIDTRGPMLTTAGSLALTAAPASRDATIVAKLRKAGAVILGKANLAEWANFRSSHSVGPWSAVGGLIHNAYILDRTACASSSGPGAAEAAGFAVVTIGTETDGSIVCPSSVDGVVGLKPSLGLVSRTGIVPISLTQDTAGPIARNVADAAAVLTVIAGSDSGDPYTKNANQHATDYSRFLDPNALQGKRVGVVRALATRNPYVVDILNHTVAVLKAHGAVVVDPVVIPHLGKYRQAEWTSLLCNFKVDIKDYLATRKGLAVHNLAQLIAFNKAHAAEEMPWFGQDNFIATEAEGPLNGKVCSDALAKAKRLSGPEGIDAAIKEYRLDALLAPTAGPARVVDLVGHFDTFSSRSRNFSGPGGSSTPAAVAGYPDITVPAGFVHCLPVGMSFFGSKWSDGKLISLAYAFERAAHIYHPPQFLPDVTYCQQHTEPAYY